MRRVAAVVLSLVWAVTCAPPLPAGQDDARLEGLFRQLKLAPDAGSAHRVELQIWQIWTESGREEVDRLMEQGISEMGQRLLSNALQTFDRVVEMAPEFAEGWNKRATVHYLLDNLDQSVYDIERTLALEPRHFGAISGMGLIFLEQGDEEGALKAFESVLEIHPQAPGARKRVDVLRARIRDKAVRAGPAGSPCAAGSAARESSANPQARPSTSARAAERICASLTSTRSAAGPMGM